MKEVYYLIVSRNHDREPIRFNKYPSDEQIAKAIKSLKGISARVEKRYELS